jgi:hypothetical protein
MAGDKSRLIVDLGGGRRFRPHSYRALLFSAQSFHNRGIQITQPGKNLSGVGAKSWGGLDVAARHTRKLNRLFHGGNVTGNRMMVPGQQTTRRHLGVLDRLLHGLYGG